MYRVHLDAFDGPFDLLLFFIQRDELDIQDIPIARLTAEFLEYVHLIQQLDLEQAGDFLLVAATLIEIKTRMLLPRLAGPDGEPEIDPRAELVERLLAYKRFKELADGMAVLEAERRALYGRGDRSADPVEAPVVDEREAAGLRDVTLYSLMQAFSRALEQMPKPTVHHVRPMGPTVDEQSGFLRNRLSSRPTAFTALLAELPDRLTAVVTLLALLELARQGAVRIELGGGPFNDFYLSLTDESDADRRAA